MSAYVGSRKKHDGVMREVRTLRHTIRSLRRRLLAETDPLAYYCALADAASAEVQLDYFCEQMDSAKECSRFVSPRARQYDGGSKEDHNNHWREP